MLEQFQIPPGVEVRVAEEDMRSTVEAVFKHYGMSAEHAARSADVLMYADLRGYDTHGVSNMLRVYVGYFGNGKINPTPKWKVIAERKATATIDSDSAHGGVIAPEAMRMAIEKAKDCGVGVVNTYNGGHYGAAAYTAAMALEHDMIGISMTSGGLMMTPTHGAGNLVGLNPISIAAPANKEAPFVFDASMSGVAGNKISLARRLGRGTLPGWIAQMDGTPIMDEMPIPKPDDFMHLPLGGTREIGSHKGYGLAMMIEVLGSVLSGAAAGPDRRVFQSQQMIAYDIAAFTDLETFKSDMDAYLLALRTATPAPGHARVMYPGLNAHEVEIDRRENGIPYHPEVLEWFDTLCSDQGIPSSLPKPK